MKVPKPKPGRPETAATTLAARSPAQKAVAKNIAASGDLHRLLVDSVRDYAVFALDPGGYIISWNEGARRIKGYTADEIIGKHFSTFYPASDIKAGKPPWELEEAVRVGRLEDEGWRIRKDGSAFWANVTITPLRDDSGELVGFAKVTRDLTDRRRAEELLRESEERIRLLIHTVKDYAIFLLDPTGKVASWNEGAHRIKGYTAEEIIGRHFSTFYPAADVAAGKPKWELEVAVRDGRFEEEGWRVRKDGSLFWANVVITTLRNDDNTVIGFAKISRDLTERRASQERAIADARRIAQVEASSTAKSEFLAAMSHELRTPLNAIGGYAELIEMGVSGPVSERTREYIGRIRGSQQHLLGVINDLLNYSKVEAGHVHYDTVTVPVHDMVDKVLPLLEPQATARRLTLTHAACPPGLLGRADTIKAEQIVLNLLSNAVKFTPPGGRVTVTCGQTRDSVTITVRDTGPGIPEEKQNAIFEPFVQLGRSLSSPNEGTGLGLAISRDMARAMGGNISVESAEGEGSTFTFTLPRATDE